MHLQSVLKAEVQGSLGASQGIQSLQEISSEVDGDGGVGERLRDHVISK